MGTNRVLENFVIDVDGVMTDGKFHYSIDGKVMKVFGPDDGDALHILSNYLTIHFITGDKRGFGITKKRIVDDMGYPLDLVSTFERSVWIKQRYNPEKTVYMGDGIFDPLVFADVGYGIAPANASLEVAQAAHYVTTRKGAEGAVAEACFYLLRRFFTGFDLHSYKFGKEVGVWKASEVNKNSSAQSTGMMTRKKSLLTGKANLEHLYTIKDCPVFMGCVDVDHKGDDCADMIWDICKDTGLIQLRNLAPLNAVYPAQHCDSTGRTWKNHHNSFVRFIEKHKPTNVLEIGGGSGFMAQRFVSRNKNVNWNMVEPNPTIDDDKRIRVIQQWFDDSFTIDEPIDTVIHSHVLEHVYDPIAFFKHIHGFLQPKKKQIFSVPNLYLFIKQKYTNGLNFEHTLFITEEIIDYLLNRNGFKILDKYYYLDHSIFYATQITNPAYNVKAPQKYQEYKQMFNDFVTYHKEMVTEINKQIETFDGQIYLFGAHIFSQYLLAFGLKQNKIVAILDNSPAKQGKRLYGTRFEVFSPKILKGKKRAGIILKAGHYNEEIKKDILENISKTVTFW